jgi:hypothetical protein
MSNERNTSPPVRAAQKAAFCFFLCAQAARPRHRNASKSGSYLRTMSKNARLDRPSQGRLCDDWYDVLIRRLTIVLRKSFNRTFIRHSLFMLNRTSFSIFTKIYGYYV